MVDVFRAIIGVEATDHEGERLDQSLQYRQQKVFADAFAGTDELELGDLIDKVDVEQALDAVAIALVDRIHAQEAGVALGAGLAPLADIDFDWTGLVHRAPAALVGFGLAQVVEVAIGDSCQALVAGVSEEHVGALTELPGSGGGQGAVQGVDLGQQHDILAGMAPREGAFRSAMMIPDTAGLAVLGDQPGHLCPRAAGDLAQVAPDQALVGLAQASIAEQAQVLGDELVGSLAVRNLESERLSPSEEGADLLQGLESLGV